MVSFAQETHEPKVIVNVVFSVPAKVNVAVLLSVSVHSREDPAFNVSHVVEQID